MDAAFWQTLGLTFQLAAITTFVLLLIGIPLAYYLANTQSRMKPILEAFISMPLVLPPTVLGFLSLDFIKPRKYYWSLVFRNL